MPNQWPLKDGVLSTAHKLTPQGGWVAGCGLKTKRADCGDCKISFDFRLPEFGNSGVWLRGNCEINPCDSCGGTPDGKPHPGLHNKSGFIGFLGHTMPVRFRNIRRRELEHRARSRMSGFRLRAASLTRMPLT